MPTAIGERQGSEMLFCRIFFYSINGISSRYSHRGLCSEPLFFSTKPNRIGTGLGLSISHGIISEHGGKLMINSVEGEFTIITIDLPATIDEEI